MLCFPDYRWFAVLQLPVLTNYFQFTSYSWLFTQWPLIQRLPAYMQYTSVAVCRGWVF